MKLPNMLPSFITTTDFFPFSSNKIFIQDRIQNFSSIIEIIIHIATCDMIQHDTFEIAVLEVVSLA